MVSTYSLKHTEYTYCINVSSELRSVKAYLDVTLSCQIINLCRAHLADYSKYRHRVSEVCIVQVEIILALKMGDALAEVY